MQRQHDDYGGNNMNELNVKVENANGILVTTSNRVA